MGTSIDTLKGRAKLPQRREPYWKKIERGCHIGYRRTANGGTWIVRIRTPDGKRTYAALGAADDIGDGSGHDFEKARALARKQLLSATGGLPRNALTVSHLLDQYLAFLKGSATASTYRDTRNRIENVLKKAPLAAKKLTKLEPLDLTTWRNAYADGRKPDTVNRVLAILKAALNFGYETSRLFDDDLKWRPVKRMKGGGEARKIFLTAAQSQLLLDKCLAEDLRKLVKAAVLTGARFGELAALRVGDFDSATGTLAIPSGKTGSRTMFLGEDAFAFFASIAASRAPDAPMLARANGKRWKTNNYQPGFTAAVKAAALDPDTTFYALRHTYISMAILAGVVPQIVAENCGTSVKMIEQHYAKFFGQERRNMLGRVKVLPTEGVTQ